MMFINAILSNLVVIDGKELIPPIIIFEQSNLQINVFTNKDSFRIVVFDLKLMKRIKWKYVNED